MNGPIPTRVERAVKERLLGLVDDAIDAGWTLSRVCLGECQGHVQ